MVQVGVRDARPWASLLLGACDPLVDPSSPQLQVSLSVHPSRFNRDKFFNQTRWRFVDANVVGQSLVCLRLWLLSLSLSPIAYSSGSWRDDSSKAVGNRSHFKIWGSHLTNTIQLGDPFCQCKTYNSSSTHIRERVSNLDFHPTRNLTSCLWHILRHNAHQSRCFRRQSPRSLLRCIRHAAACKPQCCTEKSTLSIGNFRRIVVCIAAMRRLA